MDQLAVFRTITTRCQMDKGWINTVMQGFIEPRLHPSVDAIVVFYYSYLVYRDFFAIKSDKNHQLQSKSHRNNNDKNSICKRIII